MRLRFGGMTASPPVSAILSHMVGVIALIGDDDIGDEAIDKLVREGDVVALSRRSDQAQRISQCVARGVDFGAQPSARAAQALGIRPPFSGERRRRADAPARWSSRSSAFEVGLARRTASIPSRTPISSSDSSAASPPRACPTAWADRANNSLSAPFTAGVQKPTIVGAGTALALAPPRYKRLKPLPLVIPKRVAVLERAVRTMTLCVRILTKVRRRLTTP